MNFPGVVPLLIAVLVLCLVTIGTISWKTTFQPDVIFGKEGDSTRVDAKIVIYFVNTLFLILAVGIGIWIGTFY